MKLQRMLLLLMVAVEAAALHWVFKVTFFPILACVLAALGFASRARLTLSSRWKALASFAILLVFFVKWRLVPFEETDVAGSMGFVVTYVFAQYFIMLQVLELWTRADRHSATAVLYAMLALIFAGNAFVSMDAAIVYALSCVVLVCCVAVYLRGCVPAAAAGAARPGGTRTAWLAGSLAAAVLLGAGAVLTLYANREFLSRQLTGAFTDRDSFYVTGFSSDVTLGDVAKLKFSPVENRTALRVFAESAPGHLRGRAFGGYRFSRRQGVQWVVDSARTPAPPAVPPPPDLPAPRPGCNQFTLSPGGAGRWQRVEVWPAPFLTEGMFVPLETSVLEAPVTNLRTDEYRITDSNELVGGVNYASYVPGSEAARPEQLPDAFRERLTTLPPSDPRVRALADRVFAGCAGPREKMDAVVRFFNANYRYGTSIRVPAGRDPLTYFLLERPPAHCEYFAAGAAVLLRLGGVPARYITGFVAVEWNPYGEYWVARNRDAHAWVEAYDDSAGWVTVDATPASDDPRLQEGRSFDHLLDYLSFRLQEVTAAIRVNGLGGLARWLGDRAAGLWTLFLSPHPAVFALKMLAAAALAFLLLRRLWKPRRRSAPVEGRVRRLHALLSRVDRRLARTGLVREEAETLHQFARRILDKGEPRTRRGTGRASAAAGWYTRYAVVRYRGTISDADIERLDEEQSRI